MLGMCRAIRHVEIFYTSYLYEAVSSIMQASPQQLTQNGAEQSLASNQFFVWGASPAMKALHRVAADTAATDIPVLLIGESGTGKEVLALQIHRMSDRRNEPFIKTRCRSVVAGRLPVQLQSLSNNGGFSNHFRGTVFLDEICELETGSQRQLLDLLSDGDSLPGEYAHGGRVISAARRGLEEDLRCGKFAEELYFRLNGVCLRIPPLRERKDDVPELVDFFLTKYAGLFERMRPVLSQEIMARLSDYSWPGNVRQLENTTKKIVATGDFEVALSDLVDFSPDAARASAKGSSLKATARAASRQAERELISRALTRTHWNRKKAAQELQISYKALLYKLKQLGLEDSEGS
jgi:two-component system, NtrC family, response regulator AtoC